MSERITVWLVSPADRPNYSLQWIDPGTGKRRTRSTGTSDPQKAEQARGDLEARLNDPNAYSEATAPRLTWAELCERFADEHLAGLSPGHRRNAHRVIDRLEHLIKPKSPADLNNEAVSAYIRDQVRRGIMPATQSTERAILAKLIRWAADAGYLLKVPKVNRPKLIDAGPPTRLLTAEGFADLSQRIEPRTRGMLAVGWFQGLRRTEMLTLSWERQTDRPWIDWEANRIQFPAKASKGKRFSWLPLAPGLRAFLADRDRTGRVLAEAPTSGSAFATSFVVAAERCGYNLRLHDLRRSFATHYAPKVPAQVLQRLMRHANITVTLKYYANLDPSLEAAIALG